MTKARAPGISATLFGQHHSRAKAMLVALPLLLLSLFLDYGIAEQKAAAPAGQAASRQDMTDPPGAAEKAQLPVRPAVAAPEPTRLKPKPPGAAADMAAPPPAVMIFIAAGDRPPAGTVGAAPRPHRTGHAPRAPPAAA